MNDPNSAATMIRPQDLMQELGIGKDAYYADVKFLEIKPQRDTENRIFLDESQANLIRSLRQHVQKTGKRDGFSADQVVGGAIVAQSAQPLATASPAKSNLVKVEIHQPEQQPDPVRQQIIAEASSLAAHNMTMPHQLILTIAEQMGYTDLLPSDQAKVDAITAACSPKNQAALLGNQILQEHRQGTGQNTHQNAAQTSV